MVDIITHQMYSCDIARQPQGESDEHSADGCNHEGGVIYFNKLITDFAYSIFTLCGLNF